MNQDEKDLLRHTAEMAEENNIILRKLYRAHKWSKIWRVTYWTLIILVSIGAYVYVQPYIDQVSSSTKTTVENVKDIADSLRNISTTGR